MEKEPMEMKGAHRNPSAERLNVLITGAGVAGLTLANLLQKQGFRYRIIEKETREAFNRTGYMLGLLPLGGRVLTQLGLREAYFERSIEMSGYEIHKEDGSLNKAFSLDFINQEYGSYRGIGRMELVELLTKDLDPNRMRMGTSATEIRQYDNCVDVSFSNGEEETFDIVVIADGLRSETRNLLWNSSEHSTYDTHWGGWVGWLDTPGTGTYKEYWGASSFLGLYPIKGKTGVFLGGPNKLTEEQGLQAFAAEIKNEVLYEFEVLHDALDMLASTTHPYNWKFSDGRTEQWRKGNAILLGDAACGFLPTAGVGASMAMDSASALADELSRTDINHIAYGLKLYEKRQKSRAEKAQDDSRKLAKYMFVETELVAGIRDYAIGFYTLKQLVKNIAKSMEG